MEKKSLLKILGLFLLLIVLGLVTFFMPVRTVTKKGAAGTGSISLQPATGTIAVNGESTIQINLNNPGNKRISFVDVRLNYDRAVLEVTNFTPNSEAFPTDLTANDPVLLGRDSGQAKLQALNSTNNLKSETTILIGTIRVKGKTAGTSTIIVDETASQIVHENIGSTDLVLALSGSTGSTYTVTGGTVPALSCTNISVDQQSVAKGQSVNVSWNKGTDTGISALFVRKSGTTNWIHIHSGDVSSAAVSTSSLDLGAYDVSVNVFDKDCTDKLMCINYASGAGATGLEGRQYEVSACPTDGSDTRVHPDDYTACTNTCRTTFTVTEPGAGSPVLNFKVKFQGVDSDKEDQKMKVIVKKGELVKSFTNVNVSADADGLYSGSVTLTDVPTGTDYAILIKGPKHLAKKCCENRPSTRCTGNGNISLTTGVNDYDFSTQELPAGDLPNPADNMQQDGVVNSVDYSLWNARFGREDADSLAVADLDLNGVVNSADWGLMRITLETRYEED